MQTKGRGLLEHTMKWLFRQVGFCISETADFLGFENGNYGFKLAGILTANQITKQNSKCTFGWE